MVTLVVQRGVFVVYLVYKTVGANEVKCRIVEGIGFANGTGRLPNCGLEMSG